VIKFTAKTANSNYHLGQEHPNEYTAMTDQVKSAEPEVSTEERLAREREFHNAIFSTKGRAKLSGLYAIAQASEALYEKTIESLSPGANILEYGCGPHSNSVASARLGANVVGIDISDAAIEISTKVCSEALANEPAVRDRIRFQRMNAEALEFDDNHFDVVCGRAILHHLDLRRSFTEISRVLKPGGVGVFVEPMGHNPFINWYRDRTPELRTPDEHPFMVSDLKLAEQYFSNVNVEYFHLSSLGLVPFKSMIDLGKIVAPFDFLDKGIFKVMPWLRKHAWSIVMTMKK
jgi:SAM-dependent methyltransferase